MSEISLKDVHEATEELINALGAAQRNWAKSRVIDSGVVERLAVYCALRAMARVFPVEVVVDDPESIETLNRLSDGIRITTATAEELHQKGAKA